MDSLAENPIRLRRGAGLAAGFIFLILYLVWLVVGRSAPFERFLAGNLAMIFSSLLAACLAYWARQQQKAVDFRKAWTWLLAGLIFWLLGDLLRMAYQVLVPSLVYQFSLLDGIYLAGSLTFWVGLLVYPRQARSAFGRLLPTWDAALTTAAVISLVWLVVLKPILDTLAAGAHGNPVAVLYPLADLGSLVLLMSVFLLSDAQQFPAPFGWICLGLIAYTCSDLAYASLLLQGQYQTGSLTDAGWVLGDLLVSLAALAQLKQLAVRSIRPPTFGMRLLDRFQSLLPYLATLALAWYSLLMWQIYGQTTNSLGLWATVVLSLGLIARQGILAGEIELQKYANLVNSVAEPAFVCDNRGRLRLVNPALLTTSGYNNPNELLEQPLQKLLDPTSQAATSLLSLALRQGWSGELSLLRKDGLLVPVSLSLRPLRPSRGERLALAGTAHDLTEQKQQQAALQAAYEQIAADRAELAQLNTGLEHMVAEKTASLTQAYQQLEEQHRALQELDRLKSDFISMVSHELRAPLTNINGGIELLLAGAYPVSRRVSQNLVLVQAEIQRLTRFVETILDLTALDAGRAPLYPAPVALHTVVETLRQQMTHLNGAQRVRWLVPADLPSLLADEQALTSILFHLLDNAFKYAPGGLITVSTGAIDQRVWIQVEDEGPGIPEEALSHLFDQFYRLNSGDSQMVYGHGLGLYIVRRLLDAMGGEITVKNRPQGGASFICWLPLVIESEEENAL
ncbi:MAG: ATP-binding protein [Anaerolineaceae bacterium]|nr:ATP-binding protein [Anaerolineaceae bacterium]